jgi:dUTP pyrophosphatase
MDGVKLRIKYHNKEIEKLTYIDGKSDWIDLRCAEETVFSTGDFKLVNLGISIALPEGYEALVVPRSSTFKTWGLLQTNSCGVIDETYCGDDDVWKWPAYATRDTVLHVNDRICQFRILKHQPALLFEETEKLTGESRGGFGSTGTN